MISIAMATYNGEKYLREQVDSILAQTIQDFELIICDDCSTDSTVEILNDYAEKDSRIKVFVNEKNLGFKRNFEKAIGLCSGEYIALSDQDDIWLPEHLEVLIENIGNNNLICGDDVIIDSSGKETKDFLSHRLYFDFDNNYDFIYRIFCDTTIFSGHSCLYRKQFIERVLPFPEKCNSHDGWISACASVLDSELFIPIVISKYRLHGKNVSGNHKKDKIINRLKKLLYDRFETDRLSYFKVIFERFTEISEENKKKLLECEKYLNDRIKGTHRFWTLKFMLKNYSDIYTTKSKKELPFRIISVLVKKGEEKI